MLCFVTFDPSSFGPERFSSRELSRLEFGSRLLDLADDQSLPVLERCKFVAIFDDMIDEFFQVRIRVVGGGCQLSFIKGKSTKNKKDQKKIEI